MVALAAGLAAGYAAVALWRGRTTLSGADRRELRALDVMREGLSAELDVWPARPLKPLHEQNLSRQLQDVVAGYASLASRRPRAADAVWRLGEARRLAAMLGWPGAFEAAEDDLARAGRLRPRDPRPEVSLGYLYLRAGPAFAARADAAFARAQLLHGGSPTPAVKKGLFLARLMMGRASEAQEEGEIYLSLQPGDDGVRAAVDALRAPPGKTRSPQK